MHMFANSLQKALQRGRIARRKFEREKRERERKEREHLIVYSDVHDANEETRT